MRDIEFSKLIGGIDEELAASAAPAHTARSKRDTVIPERSRFADFLHRAAAVAAAVLLLVLIPIGTARAAGVSVVLPFISREGSTLRLDYSAGLERHEDAPEITAEPSTAKPTESVEAEHLVFTSEEEYRARFGGVIRMPGEDIGMELVRADTYITEGLVLIDSNYLYENNVVYITSRSSSVLIGTVHAARTLVLSNVSRYKSSQICGIDCTLAYGVPWNYIDIVIENESYLIFGELEMDELEIIAESLLTNAH